MFYVNQLRKLPYKPVGIFLEEDRQLIKAIQLLESRKLLVEVTDTTFAYLYEEAQKVRALYEIYRPDLNSHAIAIQMQSKSWSIQLMRYIMMGVSKEVGNINHYRRQLQGTHFTKRYTCQMGLFFNSGEDLLTAAAILGEQGFLFQVISLTEAMLLNQIQQYAQSKKISLPLERQAKIAEYVLSFEKNWKKSLLTDFFAVTSDQVFELFFLQDGGRLQEFYRCTPWRVIDSGETLSLNETDCYSPALRPDLFSERSQTRCIQPEYLNYHQNKA